MKVAVSEHLLSSAPEAIARLSYLFPDLQFDVTGDTIEVLGDISDELVIRREVAYALYRQRIFVQSLPLRVALLRTLGES